MPVLISHQLSKILKNKMGHPVILGQWHSISKIFLANFLTELPIYQPSERFYGIRANIFYIIAFGPKIWFHFSHCYILLLFGEFHSLLLDDWTDRFLYHFFYQTSLNTFRLLNWLSYIIISNHCKNSFENYLTLVLFEILHCKKYLIDES